MREHVIIVISDLAMGRGPSTSAQLLANEMYDCGVDVTICATFACERTQLIVAPGIEVLWSLFSHGCRFNLPIMGVVARAWAKSVQRKSKCIFVFGPSNEAAAVLKIRWGCPVGYIETCNALSRDYVAWPRLSAKITRADKIFVPSNAIERCVRENYGYQGKIEHLPFWVQDPGFLAESANNGPVDLLYVGHIHETKGVLDLLRALEHIKQDAKCCPRCVIVGGGNSGKISDEIRGRGLNELVELRGYTVGEELDKLYRKSRWLILPSHYEGLPLVLMEALGRGIPIITTPVGAIVDVLPEDKAVIHVTPRDPVGLANKICAILNETEEIYLQRRLAARTQFLRVCDKKTVRSRIKCILDSMCI